MIKSQPSEAIELWLPDANKTVFCGSSLIDTLYHFPCTVYLSGELGAGKTTFVQGLARALGIGGPLTSPTFALEQRYTRKNDLSFLHLDLYRLKDEEARALVDSTHDFEGLRCIEWAEKLGDMRNDGIHIHLHEEKEGRRATITFFDVPLPTKEEIRQWRKDVRLPSHIIDHCESVASVAAACADDLLKRGIVVRRRMAQIGGQLHDLLRFIDFKDMEEYADYDPAWKPIKETYDGMKHEAACATFLHGHGHDALARVIEVHGLQLPSPDRTTIEQKLLFYADKRVALDKIVTLQERFDDFKERYGKSMQESSAIWMEEAKKIERELFPDGPPV